MSRGDRRMAEVIYEAWRNGAKFDAWQDHFKLDVWLAAFETNGLDPLFYSSRLRTPDEVFPWDHIDAGITKRTLRREYERSQRFELQPDCRTGCYGCGVNQAFSSMQPDAANPRKWFCPVIGRPAAEPVGEAL